MGAGVLLALTIPGLAVLLVAPAAAEAVASRPRRRSPLARQHGPALSAAGADVFSAALVPGRVDLDAGVAHLVLPPADVPSR